MKTKNIITLIAAIVSLAACTKPDTPETPAAATQERMIVYAVDNDESRQSLKSEAEWETMVDRFCDYAQEGHSVTFYNMSSHPAAQQTLKGNGHKEVTTISTTSRDKIKDWMKEMEREGKTVNVVYDKTTGTWTGTAYISVARPVVENDCYTGVMTTVTAPALDEPQMPGIALALRVDDTTTLLLVENGYLLMLGSSDDSFYIEGDTMTFCGTVSTLTDLNGEEYHILDIAAVNPGSVEGRWQYICLAVTTYNNGSDLLSTVITMPEEVEIFEFAADGNAMHITGTTTANGTWSLTDEGELCCELLAAGGGCWTINWLTDATMIITRTVMTDDGKEACYQMQFEKI